MTSVAFVEHPSHLARLGGRAVDIVVAATAEVALALEEAGVRYTPARAFVSGTDIASCERVAAQQLLPVLRSLGDHLSVAGIGHTVGADYLLDHAYHLLLTAGAVALRTSLVRNALKSLGAERAMVFRGPIDPLFVGDGYEENPWLCGLDTFCARNGIDLRRLDHSPVTKVPSRRGSISRQIRQAAASRLARYRRRPARPRAARLSGVRLLFGDPSGHDWALVRPRLEQEGAEIVSLTAATTDDRFWTAQFDNPDRGDREPPRRSALANFSEAFELWRSTARGSIRFADTDVLPALVPHLRAVAEKGLSLAEHNDYVARAALDELRPNGVAFTALTTANLIRLARAAAARGIPTMCYQHGGSYGVRDLASVALTEFSFATHFLTYGPGVEPARSLLPSAANLVPVGSARIDAVARAEKPSARTPGPPWSVLYVAELSSRNTFGAGIELEDTARFDTQRQALRTLSSSSLLTTTYRPLPYMPDWQATPRWLERERLPRVKTDASAPIVRLLAIADVVVSDTAAGTVWLEAIALRKRLIVFCEPTQSRFHDAFVQDLEGVATWCQSPDALVSTLGALANEGVGAIAAPDASRARRFLSQYVIHEGNCADRAVDAIAGLVARPSKDG